jgi:succinate dehydrogenase / fumarate reductase, membrane anchor subunit
MTSKTTFISGRTGRGAAYASDASGAPHDKFMRLSSWGLAPLGLLSAWFIAGLAGKSYEAAWAELAHPFPALTLIAFMVLGAVHARLGADNIILDYVHDPELKEKALRANKWASIALAVLWTFALLLIAAPR